MNNLIKIQVNEQGKQIVSAKELYLGLGLNKAVWSRWYKTNIENNEFFTENIDWVGVQHDVEGNETMDFAITLEFAKHIAMMAKTKKSHEYRNYFIECEKQLKTGQPKQLSADIKQKEIETKNNNSFARVLNSYDKALKNPNITKEVKDSLNKNLNQFLEGNPKEIKHLGKKTYSATEIGKKLGITSNRVGKLTEAHKLKTEEFGEWFKDVAKHSSKEVPTFRYYDNIIPVLKGLLDGKQFKLDI